MGGRIFFYVYLTGNDALTPSRAVGDLVPVRRALRQHSTQPRFLFGNVPERIEKSPNTPTQANKKMMSIWEHPSLSLCRMRLQVLSVARQREPEGTRRHQRAPEGTREEGGGGGGEIRGRSTHATGRKVLAGSSKSPFR